MKPKLMNEDWWKLLAPSLSRLTIQKKLKKGRFCPENAGDIFRAFYLLKPKDVRVVLLGLSPYPDKEIQPDGSIGNACGLAFAHQDRDYEYWTFSMKVIGHALAQDYGIASEDIHKYLCTNLLAWEVSGVMLLNAALTCEMGKPESHLNDWYIFILDVLKIIHEQNDRIIFYSFGSYAKDMLKPVNRNKHYVFNSMHPASLYYNKNMKFNSHFKEVDEIYKRLYGRDIGWLLPF